MKIETQLTAVEWLVDQMRQRKEQGLTLSFYDLEMFASYAKAMEEDEAHKAYLYGHEVGFMKAKENQNELTPIIEGKTKSNKKEYSGKGRQASAPTLHSKTRNN